MRFFAAIALCLVLGACATKPDIYGEYDLARFMGEDVPGDFFSDGWVELNPDGTWRAVANRVDGSEPTIEEGGFAVGEEVDGCVLFDQWFSKAPDEPFTELVPANVRFTGKICDGEWATDCGKGLGYKRN